VFEFKPAILLRISDPDINVSKGVLLAGFEERAGKVGGNLQCVNVVVQFADDAVDNIARDRHDRSLNRISRSTAWAGAGAFEIRGGMVVDEREDDDLLAMV
jgi:hypothetical protein